MNARRTAHALALGCACMALSAALCVAGTPAEPGRPILEKLLKAVQTNDYDSFVADGTAAVKSGITKQMVEGLSAQLSPRMKQGYEIAFLGDLKQQGCQVRLWKLTFKDGGDDILAKLVLKDDKVAGFWLQ